MIMSKEFLRDLSRRRGSLFITAITTVTLYLGGGLSLSVSSAAAASQHAPPNLLFIVVDEQRYDTLAAAGNNRIQVPNLNRLAEESLVFQRAYCCQPVCGPSRSSIFTGTWPHWNGQTENRKPMRDKIPCLPALISKGGYVKAFLGHVGALRNGQGAVPSGKDVDVSEHFRWPPDSYLRPRGASPAGGDRFDKLNRMLLPEELSGPKYLAERAERFLDRVEGRPFLLCCSFYEPHGPFYGPFNHVHAPEDVILPRNFADVPQRNQPLKAQLEQRWFYQHGDTGTPGPLRTEHDWRVVIARYWGLCTLVDKYIGRILQALRDRGLYENTLIVFTADHGEMMGSHRMMLKNMAFEESVRVPLLIRLPGQTESKRIAAPVSQIDLVPTLLDLLGQDAPAHLQGKSLRPLIDQSSGPPSAGDVFFEWHGINALVQRDLQRDPLPEYIVEIATRERALAALADPVRSLVTPDGWKLNYSPLGEHELYNLNRDPGETQNLAGKPEHRHRMNALGRRIKRWQKETEDPVQLPDLGRADQNLRRAD